MLPSDSQRSTSSGMVAAAGSGGAPQTGQSLGKYLLGRRLGEGGMGVVFEATDTVLKRSVAVKLLPAARSADAEALQRFLREAQAAARLNHPHVVVIHEIARVGAVDFLVMELV